MCVLWHFSIVEFHCVCTLFQRDILLIQNQNVKFMITLLITLTLSRECSSLTATPCCVVSVAFDEDGHSESLRLVSYYMLLLSHFLSLNGIFCYTREWCDFVEKNRFVLLSCASGEINEECFKCDNKVHPWL